MSLEPTLLDVKLEFVDRWSAGERPTIGDYIRQFPQWADDLARFAVSFAAALVEPDDAEESCDEEESDAMARVVQEASARSEGVQQSLIDDLEGKATLTDRLEAVEAGVDDYAEAVNIPPGIATMVVRGALDELPKKLIQRTARFCRTTLDAAASMMSAPVERVSSFLLRSRGDGPGGAIQRRTFRAAMLLYRRDGELTDAQALDWHEEIGG